MRTALGRIRAFYGAHPLHLLALLVCFALAGYAALQAAAAPAFPRMLIWFGAAVIAHDLVLFPLYALADRSLTAAVRRRHTTAGPRPPVVNHIRVPALAAGLLVLLYFPGILQLGTATFVAATGQTQEPFAERWLLLTAAFFTLSAVLYAARLARAPARRRTERG